YLADHGAPAPLRALHDWLHSRLQSLQADHVAGFKDIRQARRVLDLTFNHVLPADRTHHQDLLFHVCEGELFQPFFLARVCEAVLTAAAETNGAPPDVEPFAAGVVSRLNDFVGHRPLAILETRPRGEPYDHERVRPIPLFIRNAG